MNVCDTLGCDREIPDHFGAFCNEHTEAITEELENRRDEWWDDQEYWAFVQVDAS